MVSLRTLFWSLLATTLLVMMSGCRAGDEHPPSEPQSDTSTVYDLKFQTPSFSDGRTLDTMLAVDLDASGRVSYIVTSMAHDTSRYLPPTARADMIQIYRFDTVSRSFVVVASDSLEWITALNLRDVTGDRLPELVVSLYSGGNDIVASSGMYIYSGEGGKIRPVLKLDGGNPEFKQFKHSDGDAIIVYSELWPDFFAHAEAVPYVDDIMAFQGDSFVSARAEHQDFFRDQATEYLATYRSTRDSLRTMATDSLDEGGVYGLFSPAALAMRSFALADAVSSLRSFWSSEQSFLQKTLPDSQYTELESIYQSALPQ